MKNKLQLFEAILPLIIGISLTFKGYSYILYDSIIGIIILTFGILFIIYSSYELIKKRHSYILRIIVHSLEGIAFLLLAYLYNKEDKIYLQYFALAISIAFFISVIIFIIMKKNSRNSNNKK